MCIRFSMFMVIWFYEWFYLNAVFGHQSFRLKWNRSNSLFFNLSTWYKIAVVAFWRGGSHWWSIHFFFNDLQYYIILWKFGGALILCYFHHWHHENYKNTSTKSILSNITVNYPCPNGNVLNFCFDWVVWKNQNQLKCLEQNKDFISNVTLTEINTYVWSSNL